MAPSRNRDIILLGGLGVLICLLATIAVILFVALPRGPTNLPGDESSSTLVPALAFPTLAPATAFATLAIAPTGGTTPVVGSPGRLAFVTNRDGSKAAIFVANADGSQPISLISGPANIFKMAYSPDGSRIAFGTDRDKHGEIYVMNANGGYPTRLTDHPAGSAYPTWSPDGTRIAFESQRGGSFDIYSMSVDGSQVIRLTVSPTDDGCPDWSPDGGQIVFHSNRDGNFEIYAMNADGSQPVRLTSTLSNQLWPQWSPDGTRIAFVSMRDGNQEIYVMNADGSQQTRLTRSAAIDTNPAWSGDGRLIFFDSERDGNRQIYSMRPDGSQQTRISSNSAWEGLVAWQPREPFADSQRIPPASAITPWPTYTQSPIRTTTATVAASGQVGRTATRTITTSASQPVVPGPAPTATGTPRATATVKPTVTIAPTLNPSAIKGELLFQDSLASNKNMWIEGLIDQRFYLQDGQYHINAFAYEQPVVAFTEKKSHIKDFVLEADLALLEGPNANGYGIVFRMVDNAFYFLELSGDGRFRFRRIEGERRTTLLDWTPHAAIKTGKASNTLRVVAQGPLFSFFVNDTLIGSISDSSLLDGTFGVAVSQNDRSGGTHAFFDNLSIFKPGAPTGSPVPGNFARGEVFFQDDFSANKAGWLEGITKERWFFQDGSYHLSLTKPRWMIEATAASDMLFRDLVVEVDATLLEAPKGSTYGLQFRQSGGDCYWFGVSSEGEYRFRAYIKGKWANIIPWSPSAAVQAGGRPNKLQVVARGNSFAFFINGVQVGAAQDDSLREGTIAVFVGANDEGQQAHAAFSNLSVWALLPEAALPAITFAPTKTKAPPTKTDVPPTTTKAPSTKTDVPPTKTPDIPPGLYVTGLRTDPLVIGPSTDVGFFVTFLNTTGAPLQNRWNVYVFRTDNPKKSIGEASAQTTAIPVGSAVQQALGSWRIGVGACGDYIARVGWLDEGRNITYLLKPDGGTYELWFHVCQ